MKRVKASFKEIDQKIVALLSLKAQTDENKREAIIVLHRDYWSVLDWYVEVKLHVENEILRELIIDRTIERAAKKIGTFDPSRAGLRTWMSGIARNIAKEMVRERFNVVDLANFLTGEDNREGKPRTRSEIPMEDPKDPMAAHDCDPMSLLTYLLRTSHMDCLERLDAKYRVLIEMVLDGKSKEFYESEFQITDDNYRQRLSRAVKQLRLCISKKHSDVAPKTEEE